MTADSESSPSAPHPRRKGLRVLGLLIALLAVSLCGYALARDWPRVADSFRDVDPVSMLLAVLLSAGSMAWLAVLWQRCLTALGSPAPFGDVTVWYFIGELGKYIPGGVWQVIGRSELAHRSRSIPRSTSYASTLLSYAVMCLGAILACAILAPFLATGSRGAAWAWLILPAVVVVPLLVHPALTGAALRVISRLTRRDVALKVLPWATMLRLILWSVPAWLLLGAASTALAHGLDMDANPLRVGTAAVAAWVVGFLAVPVPAGAGVREMTFASLSGLTVGPAVALALLARVVLMIVDAGCGVAALAMQRHRDARA